MSGSVSMGGEGLLWVSAYFAYLAAGFVLFCAGKGVGRRINGKEKRDKR